MTEEEWLTSSSVEPMPSYICDRASDRKLRLLAVSVIRQHPIWSATSQLSQRAIELAEQHADGLVRQDALVEIRKQISAQHERRPPPDAPVDSRYSAEYVTVIPTADEAGFAIGCEAKVLASCLQTLAYDIALSGSRTENEGVRKEVVAQLTVGMATLCRHHFGNPFRPFSSPSSWPALVVDLAQQLYDGADVRHILHDALLDAGHADLAEHFQVEDWHPKGCFAMDVILGRE